MLNIIFSLLPLALTFYFVYIVEKTRVFRDAGKVSESAGIWVRSLIVWKGMLVSGLLQLPKPLAMIRF